MLQATFFWVKNQNIEVVAFIKESIGAWLTKV